MAKLIPSKGKAHLVLQLAEGVVEQLQMRHMAGQPAEYFAALNAMRTAVQELRAWSTQRPWA